MAGEPPANAKSPSRQSSSASRQSNGRPNGHTGELRERRKDTNLGNGTPATRPEAVADAVAKELKKVPIDWEIPRKTLHSSIGFLTLYLYHAEHNPRIVVYALGAALLVVVPLDVLRLRSPGFERLYERAVGFLMRESEKQATNGVIWYMVGAIWVLALYPIDIAVVSIVILSWADTAASTFGRLWGRYTPRMPSRLPLLRLPIAPQKSVAGFIAGSLTSAAIAIGFWGWMAPSARVIELGPASASLELRRYLGLGVVGLVSGLVSGIAEALDLGSLDDNLTLPIIAGGCIWGFFKFLDFVTSLS